MQLTDSRFDPSFHVAKKIVTAILCLADVLEKGTGTFDSFGWLPNHTEEKTRHTLNKVLEVLKAQGVKEFATTGYCLRFFFCGVDNNEAWPIDTFDLAFENLIKVGVVAYPSLINVPQDLEVICHEGLTRNTWKPLFS